MGIDRRKYFRDEEWHQEDYMSSIPGSGRLCFVHIQYGDPICIYCFGSKEECAEAIVKQDQYLKMRKLLKPKKKKYGRSRHSDKVDAIPSWARYPAGRDNVTHKEDIKMIAGYKNALLKKAEMFPANIMVDPALNIYSDGGLQHKPHGTK